ncbi:Uncharacterised protein [Collinsella intestinalis]|uniref:Uncharacterized protein n=1 Tax=Collinsella intestinalis TaxID=147207 RepID=A0A5K1ISJ5_9ACTN|nr:hypothetical protein [Collinsella intestinalis]VWL91641.1 Uncharacterised protein [Collinsella intestinalis]
MKKSSNVSRFKWNIRKANAAMELVKADGLQLWHGWVWTKSGPTDRPARKVCPFSDYVSKFEL